MQNCWRHIFCVLKKNQRCNFIWKIVGDAKRFVKLKRMHLQEFAIFNLGYSFLFYICIRNSSQSFISFSTLRHVSTHG
jgi:hypothetical protein